MSIEHPHCFVDRGDGRCTEEKGEIDGTTTCRNFWRCLDGGGDPNRLDIWDSARGKEGTKAGVIDLRYLGENGS